VTDGENAAGEGWLLLIYRVPSEPSRLRAAVWRRIKSLGAIYLQNSAQVKKEHVAEHFTYAELEENEVDLVKLQNWFARVRDRDVFGAEGRQAVEKWLADCEQALEGYAARVYAEEADIH